MKLARKLFKNHLSTREKKLVFTISIVLAVVISLAVWGWWVSFDLPNPVERPHSIMWDAVSLHLGSMERYAPPGINYIKDNPLVLMGAFVLNITDGGYRALVSVQIPFMIILLVSLAFIGRRMGGIYCGAIIPWVALTGPMTIGTAVLLDDLLALQAMACAAVALLVWSNEKGKGWLAPIVLIPISFGVWAATYSNGYLFLATMGIVFVAIILWQWKSPQGGAAKRM